jgi:glycosyltransferase involved in cell wall biosynthesis
METRHPLRILTTAQSVSQSPWRIGIPLGTLRQRGHAVQIIDDTAELPDADLLVMHNPSGAPNREMIERAHQRGMAVVIDVDDLLLPEYLPESARFARWWHPERFHREAEARVQAGIDPPSAISAAPLNDALHWHQECVRAADALTVTTPVLAEAYRDLNPTIAILPNCYDDSDPLWDVTPPTRATINVGFFGTEHHGPNLDLIADALAPVLRRHADVLLIEGGQGGLLARVDAPPERLVHLGWLPFLTFPLLLHQMDIVLAPLVDDPFMRSKSNIRCMTAGLVGAPVIASPVGPYASYVEHGVNGFLAAETGEWTHCLGQLVGDAGLRRSMGEANRARARQFAISSNICRWIEVYDGLLSRRCGAEPSAKGAGITAGIAQAGAAR